MWSSWNPLCNFSITCFILIPIQGPQKLYWLLCWIVRFSRIFSQGWHYFCSDRNTLGCVYEGRTILTECLPTYVPFPLCASSTHNHDNQQFSRPCSSSAPRLKLLQLEALIQFQSWASSRSVSASVVHLETAQREDRAIYIFFSTVLLWSKVG